MERSMKRKVTRIVYYETQPTRKIPKISVDNGESTEDLTNVIVGEMKKLKIVMRNEYYWVESPLPVVNNNNNNMENNNTVSALTTDNIMKFQQQNEWRSRSNSITSTSSIDTISSNATTVTATESEYSSDCSLELSDLSDEEYSDLSDDTDTTQSDNSDTYIEINETS